MPASRYLVHLAASTWRWLTEISDRTSSGKNDRSEREVKVSLKSGGVTSETNQGISLGLKS